MNTNQKRFLLSPSVLGHRSNRNALLARVRRWFSFISVYSCPFVVNFVEFNSVDNATPAPSVTAPKSCRAQSRFYETHLPAIQANAETAARLSCADADKGRPRNPRTPPATRPKTSAPKRRRETLRSSYPGLSDFSADANSAKISKRKSLRAGSSLAE
jgi:hypothetical protein